MQSMGVLIEEARPARHAVASIVRHRWRQGWRGRGPFGLPGFAGPSHAAQYGSTLLRLTAMRLTALQDLADFLGVAKILL